MVLYASERPRSQEECKCVPQWCLCQVSGPKNDETRKEKVTAVKDPGPFRKMAAGTELRGLAGVNSDVKVANQGQAVPKKKERTRELITGHLEIAKERE